MITLLHGKYETNIRPQINFLKDITHILVYLKFLASLSIETKRKMHYKVLNMESK